MSADASLKVRLLDVTPEEAGQRLDNYLLRHASGVPKTRVYRAIRKGEVRVNKGRSKPEYRVQAGDRVRVPPLKIDESGPTGRPSDAWERRILGAIVLDSADLLVINKTDLAPLVGADLGVMDRDARKMRGDRPFLFTNLKAMDGLEDVKNFIIETGGLRQSAAS